MQLILASASKQRLELLRSAAIEVAQVIAPQIDETPLPDELPRAYVLRMAEEKARKVAAGRMIGEVVLAADTVASCGRRILQAPRDVHEARTMINLLSGRRHRVLTGVCIISDAAQPRTTVAETQVQFLRLTRQQIEEYLQSNEWQGKAGGYAIQGWAGTWIPQINGSASNVIGLPLSQTMGLLRNAGIMPRLAAAASVAA